MESANTLAITPIVLIHKGNSNYLPVSIWQLKNTQNKNTPIFLIGNDDNAHFGNIISHLNYADYIAEAAEFTKAYKHYSTNPYDYELFCIQRWFVLKAAMQKHGWDSCIYLDSDIMAYTNLADAPTQVKQAGMTVSCISAHTNFVNRLTAITLFCDFVVGFYTKPNSDAELKQIYDSYIKNNGAGGVSDMTMFTLFRKKYPEQILDISATIEGQTYDVTIDYHNGFDMDGEFKKIMWKDKQPHAQIKEGKSLVKHNTLHFQGKSKEKIKDYLTTQSYSYYLFYYRAMAIFYWQKIKRKLKK